MFGVIRANGSGTHHFNGSTLGRTQMYVVKAENIFGDVIRASRDIIVIPAPIATLVGIDFSFAVSFAHATYCKQILRLWLLIDASGNYCFPHIRMCSLLGHINPLYVNNDDARDVNSFTCAAPVTAPRWVYDHEGERSRSISH